MTAYKSSFRDKTPLTIALAVAAAATFTVSIRAQSATEAQDPLTFEVASVEAPPPASSATSISCWKPDLQY